MVIAIDESDNTAHPERKEHQVDGQKILFRGGFQTRLNHTFVSFVAFVVNPSFHLVAAPAQKCKFFLLLSLGLTCRRNLFYLCHYPVKVNKALELYPEDP